MPCFPEMLDRVAISRHFLRRVPLLSSAMERSALQTQPQIPRQLAVFASHRLCLSAFSAILTQIDVWTGIGALIGLAVRTWLRVLRLPLTQLFFFLARRAQQDPLPDFTHLCVTNRIKHNEVWRWHRKIASQTHDLHVRFVDRRGGQSASFHADCELREFFWAGIGVFCGCGGGSRGREFMTEKTKIERMARFFEVEAGVFCRTRAESLVAGKTDIDSFVLIL